MTKHSQHIKELDRRTHLRYGARKPYGMTSPVSKRSDWDERALDVAVVFLALIVGIIFGISL